MKAYDYCGSPFMAVRAAQKFYPQFSNTQLSCTDGSKLHLGNQLLLKKHLYLVIQFSFFNLVFMAKAIASTYVKIIKLPHF